VAPVPLELCNLTLTASGFQPPAKRLYLHFRTDSFLYAYAEVPLPHPHFTSDKQTEAREGEAHCPRSLSWEGARAELLFSF